MADADAVPALAHACEPLSLLFDGPSGTARIGRFIEGPEAMRLVLLREVVGLTEAELQPAVSAATRLAHPQLAKVLGLGRTGGTLHVASEFMPGASLFQIARASGREHTLEPSICLKIVHDALDASLEAKRLLQKFSLGPRYYRTIFTDTIWVAEFGETLLTEVAIAPLLHHAGDQEARSAAKGDPDVAAAGATLRRLFTYPGGRVAVSAPFRDVVRGILSRSEAPSANRFRTAFEMVQALEALPAGCLATEGEVGCAIRDLMRPELERQRAQLNMHLHGADGGGAEADEDITRVFAPDDLVRQSERITERPPSVRDGAAVVAAALEPLPPQSATRLMFVEEPAAPGANAAIDSNYGETQIFVPVFGKSPGPTDEVRFAPVASVPVYQPRSADSATLSHPDPTQPTPFPHRRWLLAALLVLLGTLGVLSARLL